MSDVRHLAADVEVFARQIMLDAPSFAGCASRALINQVTNLRFTYQWCATMFAAF
jgi:hypothetical protein